MSEVQKHTQALVASQESVAEYQGSPTIYPEAAGCLHVHPGKSARKSPNLRVEEAWAFPEDRKGKENSKKSCQLGL